MQHPASHNRSLVAWLSLAQLISWGSVFYTFSLVMGPIEQELGLSRAQSSLAFSLALLVEGLLAYPVGRWIDAGHERVVMTCGSLLAALCLLLHARVTGIAGFYAVWAGLGAAMAAILYSPVFSVVTRRFPDDFRRAIIIMTFLGGLASTVFIPFTAWLIANWGWRQALVCLAGFHLLLCAPLHVLVLRGAPARRVGLQANEERTDPGLRQLLRSAPFLLIGAFVILMMAVTAALPAHMVSLLREGGMSEVWAIAIPASIGAIQVLGRLLLFFFERYFDLHLANRLIPCLLPLGLMALLAVPMSGDGQLWVLLFVLLYGLGNGMLTIVKGTAIAQYVNRDHVATLNGVLGLPLALARAGAPLMVGLLWTPTSGYTQALWLLLAMSLVGVMALMLAQRYALKS
ncbi:MAG: MFS transporter [Comamonadaceae bacterium]|nr:MFS transporter [Rhodoferax sp.]TSA10931.1 MAG: MFS transporter [Comamonadaceae bacterium]